MPIPVDPSGCARYITDVHGAAGVAWLARLPAVLAECAARWSLTILPPFPDLSYNYVAPAVRSNGEQVVLKACVPNPELVQEAEALALFGGKGIARLLDADLERGILLLERLLPGTALSDLPDEKVTRIAVDVLRALWMPAPPPSETHTLTSLARWAKGFDRLHSTFPDRYGPFPRDLVNRAEVFFHDSVARPGQPYLIHGDLHPGNILKSGDTWYAIDPKGVVGDPLWDVATLLNSFQRAALASRVDQIASLLGYSHRSIVDWAFSQAVLSAWWSYEDHGRGYEPALALAREYDSVLSATLRE